MISRQEVIAAEQKRINPVETTAKSVKQIRCQQGRFRRRLFDVSMEGIFLPCKECQRSHLITWDELALYRESFRLVIVHSTPAS